MTIQTTFTHARANFAKIWDEVINNQEVAIIKRRGAEDLAMISASELSSILETLHLMRSPQNARRLMSAMEDLKRDGIEPQTPGDLRKEVGLD